MEIQKYWDQLCNGGEKKGERELPSDQCLVCFQVCGLPGASQILPDWISAIILGGIITFFWQKRMHMLRVWLFSFCQQCVLFACASVTTSDSAGLVTVVQHSLSDCAFYWQWQSQGLPDLSASGSGALTLPFPLIHESEPLMVTNDSPWFRIFPLIKKIFLYRAQRDLYRDVYYSISYWEKKRNNLNAYQ